MVSDWSSDVCSSDPLVNALLAHCQTLPGMEMPAINGVKRPGVVHRLDRDTTGAIMFAKTDLANQHLQAQLRHKTAQIGRASCRERV